MKIQRNAGHLLDVQQIPRPAVRTDSPEPAGSWWQGRWGRFWFSPVDPVGLTVFRVLAGLLFLTWLLPFAGHLDSLFGVNGWFDRQAYREAARLIEDAQQQLGWSLLYVCGNSPVMLQVVYWASVAVLAAFTLGLAPRFTGLLSWVAVVSFSANPALEYEGDVLVGVMAFYLGLGFLIGQGKQRGQSWLSWLFAPGWPISRLTRSPRLPAEPSVGVNLAVRLFQVHFAIIMVATGLHKLQFGDWWAGVALWYPLLPPMSATLAQARGLTDNAESLMFALSLAGYAVLGWQLAFPLFAWRRGARWLLLSGAVVGWLGTAFLYNLPITGPALLVSCLAYVSAEEWRRWLDRFADWGRAIVSVAFRRAGKDEKPNAPLSVPVGVGPSR